MSGAKTGDQYFDHTGQLNSGGQWARQSIKAYAYDAETGSGIQYLPLTIEATREQLLKLE